MARFQIAEGPSKRSRRGGAWVVFLCLASLWIADPVRAQTSGQLTGQVKDATDAPLVGGRRHGPRGRHPGCSNRSRRSVRLS